MESHLMTNLSTNPQDIPQTKTNNKRGRQNFERARTFARLAHLHSICLQSGWVARSQISMKGKPGSNLIIHNNKCFLDLLIISGLFQRYSIIQIWRITKFLSYNEKNFSCFGRFSFVTLLSNQDAIIFFYQISMEWKLGNNLTQQSFFKIIRY